MLTYYTRRKHTVGSWAALFQPCTQHTGPPFCLKKNHLKSTFDQNKSSISIPPVQPPAGCCFPDEDALHCMGSTRCLAAIACTREASEMEWRSICCICSICAKIWRAIEHREVVDGLCPHDRPPNLFLWLFFLPFLSLPSYLLVYDTCWGMLAWSQREEGAADCCLADFSMESSQQVLYGQWTKCHFLL